MSFIRTVKETISVPPDIRKVFKEAIDDPSYKFWIGIVTVAPLVLVTLPLTHPTSQTTLERLSQLLALYSRLDINDPTTPTALGCVRYDPAGRCFPP